jgi:ubiquitin carboxyl-terminal hydrolase 5/13
VYERSYAIVILPEGTRIPLPEQKGNLPMKVRFRSNAGCGCVGFLTNFLELQLVQVVDALIELDSASHKADVSSFVITEELRESKFVKDLIQLDTGKKISSHGWKCGDCDKADNLWLNLSDGHIGCGRKNFDGSGGNGHALSHYKETGFPIVVKLGTITPDGIAGSFRLLWTVPHASQLSKLSINLMLKPCYLYSSIRRVQLSRVRG